MTDKERITEILKAYTKKHNIVASVVILEEYAEELVRHGAILPPCKTGDTVYSIACNEIHPFVVVASKIQLVGEEASFEYKAENVEYPMFFDDSNIGKTVFLTKEEAEQALKERESNA